MQSTLPSQDIETLQKLRSKAKSWNIPIRHDPTKRAFDIIFSLFFLVATSPVFALLSLVVRFTSPGPIFYKSHRIGRGGKVIRCWKFRSMYKDADERLHCLLRWNESLREEWETFQKLKNDPRITPIGRFLRKTSLDELPQFWNVLTGDLSIVGPRALTLVGPPDQYLQEARLLYGDPADIILSVRPGITGAWQIAGRSQISCKERYKIEAEYAKHRTFWQDLILVAKTIPAVLSSRGAF